MSTRPKCNPAQPNLPPTNCNYKLSRGLICKNRHARTCLPLLLPHLSPSPPPTADEIEATGEIRREILPFPYSDAIASVLDPPRSHAAGHDGAGERPGAAAVGGGGAAVVGGPGLAVDAEEEPRARAAAEPGPPAVQPGRHHRHAAEGAAASPGAAAAGSPGPRTATSSGTARRPSGRCCSSAASSASPPASASLRSTAG